jgi:hypothetical protein
MFNRRVYPKAPLRQFPINGSAVGRKTKKYKIAPRSSLAPPYCENTINRLGDDSGFLSSDECLDVAQV